MTKKFDNEPSASPADKERAFRALCRACDETIKFLGKGAVRAVNDRLKTGQSVHTYEVEHLLRTHLRDDYFARFVSTNIVHIVNSVRAYRHRRNENREVIPALKRHTQQSISAMQMAICGVRASASPTISAATRTAFVEDASTSLRHFYPVLTVSPAWHKTKDRFGDYTIGKSKVILDARHAFNLDAQSSVYRVDILDVKEKKEGYGYMGHWTNGSKHIRVYAPSPETVVARLRTSVMNAVMGEMKIAE